MKNANEIETKPKWKLESNDVKWRKWENNRKANEK